MNNKKDLTIKEAFGLAVKNHQNNNLQDAQNYYQQVLKIDPNHIAALNNLGAIFQRLGENQKAKKCFEKALEIDPLNKLYMTTYGDTLIFLNDKFKGFDYIKKGQGIIKFTPLFIKII